MDLWPKILMRSFMGNSILIDTWGWLVLRDKNEPRYKEITSIFQEYVSNDKEIFTTDFILDETITLIFKRLPINIALDTLEYLTTALSTKIITLIPIGPERFKKTLEMRVKFKDKPKISFTDLTTAMVMSEMKIAKIITADAHFTHLGLSFELIN